MNNLVRDTYQANGLIRSHHQLHASSQTSLQKISSSSPKFMYSSNNQPNQQQPQQQQQQQQSQQQPQQHMQFPPPPLIQQNSHPNKNELNNINFNPLMGPQLQQQQQQQPQQPMNVSQSTMMQQSNGFAQNNHTQSTILMSSMLNNNKGNIQNQQFQPQYQQYQSLQQQQQQQQYQQTKSLSQIPSSQQPQHLQQLQQPQLQPTPCPSLSQSVSQQQVPITTIMIPSTAAAQLQSAASQIQQAALQANAANSNQPQILVFMIPYMVNQQPPTVPVIPEQSSLNSTLVRQTHNQSLTRQSQIQPQPQPQTQPPTPQQQPQQPAPQQPNSLTHSRAVSSLSNAKQSLEKFYIKANFSYQAARPKTELSFQKGEILHVIDTLQNSDYGVQNWLVARVKSNGKDAEKGLIPNKRRAEEIALEQRSLDMGEHSGTLDGTSSGVLSASVGRVSFLKRRAAQRSKSLCKDNWENVVFDIGSFKLPTYERVVYKHPGFCRPVVIFGPLSDMAREKLLRDYPEKYSYPMGFNQSPDHPKVIRLKGVLDVIDQGKHALLDITPSAVEKLNFVNLAPIVIFMRTDSKSIIKEFRSRAAKSLDPNARDEDTLKRDGSKSSRKLLEQSMKLEKTWFHVFTAVLDLSTMGSEMWYRKLRETIENQQSANVWMSEKKSDKKNLMAASSSSNNNNGNEILFPMPQSQSSTSCIDDTSVLNDRFSESLNIAGSTTKSTIDLLPDGNYGNRSQLRNAYAHSLAQKLARASSEPKLNGMLSDHDDDDDDLEHDDDEDDDDDDEIIKKPFPNEFENSSSISSLNGVASYGQSSMSGSNMTYQHYPPPQMKNDPGSSGRMQQESIYSGNTMMNNAYSNGNSSNSNYHPLPPMPNDAGYHNQSMNNINTNVIDLSRNHDTRGSAFQVYSDMNHNNYHY